MGIRVALSAALTVIAVGCGNTDDLERSCSGERIASCVPFEYSVVRSASLSPDGLAVAAFDQRAQIRIELGRCEESPVPHRVNMSIRYADPDSSDFAILSLLDLQDGVLPDQVAGDDIIDVDVANPFVANAPENMPVTLIFTPRSLSGALACTGEALEVPYRTGPRVGP